jgi:hypothetical protein
LSADLKTPPPRSLTRIQGLTIGETPDPASKEKTAAWFGLFQPANDLGRMVTGPLTVKGDGSLAIGNLAKKSQRSTIDTINAEEGATIVIDKAIDVVIHNTDDHHTLILTHTNGTSQAIVGPPHVNWKVTVKDLSKYKGIEGYGLNSGKLHITKMFTTTGS